MCLFCATKRKLIIVLSAMRLVRKAKKINKPSPMASRISSVVNSNSRTVQIQKMRYFDIQLEKYR